MIDTLNKEISKYLFANYSVDEINVLNEELKEMFDFSLMKSENENINKLTYEDFQKYLACVNEKQDKRKEKGVYYTDSDVADFIVSSSFKLYLEDTLEKDIEKEDIEKIISLTIFDPTCGAGEFLLSGVLYKIHNIGAKNVNPEVLKKILTTVYGTDINSFSVLVSKLRLFFAVIFYSKSVYITGLVQILNLNIIQTDFFDYNSKMKYDIVVGNPPYVESSKYSKELPIHYGNIYANVLDKSTLFTKSVMGFVIPISYISTPRMTELRSFIFNNYSKQYLFSFADRPGCLFSSVHQKLCIIIARKKSENKLYTSGYNYWYKEERKDLFSNLKIIENNYANKKYIPKLGNKLDNDIYKKVCKCNTSLSSKFCDKGDFSLYLNMRSCFWIKVFQIKNNSSEYKEFKFKTFKDSIFSYCLLNSSIFWWFWIVISDCWHITNKELDDFNIPEKFNPEIVSTLASNLARKLEDTKQFIGSKQIDYEYKHKLCLKEINEIDDYINSLYGLSDAESLYIKEFSIKYRTSGGVKK